MTDLEYVQLLTWCRSKMNQGTKEFASKFELKKKAIFIKSQITLCKTRIKNQMRYLEYAKDPDVISRITENVNDEKDIKAKLLKEFKDLHYGS